MAGSKIARPLSMRKLALAVALLHACAVALLTLSRPAPLPIKSKRLAVHTLRLQPKTAPSAPPAKSQGDDKPRAAASSARQQPDARPSAPKAANKPKRVKEKEEGPLRKDTRAKEAQMLLATALESLGQVAPPAAASTPVKALAPIQLRIDQAADAPAASAIASYEELLAGFLHASLRLPEWGEVKVEVTLDRRGGVQTLRVLSAQSSKNRAYVEKNLPSLQFPPLERYSSSELHTLILTLVNAPS